MSFTRPTSFGLELETFVRDTATGLITTLIKAPCVPADSCGYLAEARGKEASSISEARYNLLSSITQLQERAAGYGLTLVRSASEDVPKDQIRVLRRTHGKNASQAQFMLGGEYKTSTPRAGLHIHFGSTRKVASYDSKGSPTSLDVGAAMLDIPRIIRALDLAFKDEIKAAKRVFGEYEAKPWGFEYRSLPATVDLLKVVRVVEAL